MARLFKRRGALRDATEELLLKLQDKIETSEKELESLRKEEKAVKVRLEEYE
ncbi:MAG: hypothetical protein O8C67_10840 [Candidatus Methanoperedens sp.]|nr:hypothetical protein [Candidatus Methanoperedens sp.]